jgi:uncharacterized membrane protein YccC
MQSVTRTLVRSLRRGTPRNPGADLSQLPVGLDLRGIRVAEGLRAALACTVFLVAYERLGWPPLVYAALAAFLTCLCDTGGAIRTRVPTLLAFTVIGALTWGVFGVLRGAGLAVALPLACVGIFVASFARVWGVAAAAAGNLLSVVLILSLDRALSPGAALVVAGMFAAGGLWATGLTMVVWRLHPYRPARFAIAEVWQRMAVLSADLLSLVRQAHGVSAAEWDAHARAHRRAVREEIEYARTIIMDLVRMRGRLSRRGSQALMQLETGDQVFGALVALSDLLETGETSAGTPGRQRAAVALLILLRPTLLLLSRSVGADTPVRPERLERVLATALAAAAPDPALNRIVETIADRLRIASKLAAPGGHLPGGAADASETAQPLWDRVRGPILANLAWNSAMLRHALRTAAIATPALAATQVWGGPFAHWLPITVVVTLQPFYAATWQRALERVSGTVLGGLAGSALGLAAGTPGLLAALMFPLCTVAFALRQVSYGTYIACVTPIVVVLIELIEPGQSAWHLAGLRAVFVVAGGVVAVLGWLLLWPSWEPGRLQREQRTALAAHARYAEAAITELLGEGGAAATETARRGAGVATNNLEASLARALQEPRRNQRRRLETAMVVDATLRRIAGRLSALRHDPAARAALDAPAWRRWRDWMAGTLLSLGGGGALPSARPDGTPPETVARIARQVELLEGALRHSG